MNMKTLTETSTFRVLSLLLCLCFFIPAMNVSASSLQADKFKVSGIVKDATGEPVIGASVVEKGTTNGTVTDLDGNFNLTVASNSTIVISFIGYSDQEYRISKDNTVLNVNLKEDTEMIDEVVVVGYGVQKKENLTGSVAAVNFKDVASMPVANTANMLQGRLPGVMLTNNGAQAGHDSPEIRIRGVGTFEHNDPMVLIDGVESSVSQIAEIPADDIESVSVLKDAASAAIYGARGAFGVVLISTKNPSKDKTSVTYSGNFTMKSPTKVPDVVTDGYTYAKYFNEAWSAYYDYSQTPQNINKTLKFSQEYLEELERRSGISGLPEVEIGPNGDYVYYGNTDWYKELYKKSTFATDHNISVSGSSGKTSFYVTGRYYGQDGLFRYNTDDYKLFNMRAKGAVQVLSLIHI